jgi:hypothetical protein
MYSEPFVTSPSFSMQPGSPDSLMSGLSSAGPLYRMTPPQLVQSSSTSTMGSTSAAATAYLNETIAKASALPESFYPEFLQYSKESFEQPTTHSLRQNNNNNNSKKRNRLDGDKNNKRQFSSSSSSSCSSEEDDEEEQQRPSRKQKVE